MSFALQQYRTNQAQTASPARIVVAFYDGALRFLRLAAQALDAKNYALKGNYLMRAHAIVSELRNNLDPSHAPQLVAELDQLYGFVLDCISEANVQADRTKIEPAVRVLEQLRSAWAQVAEEPAIHVVGTP